MTCGLFDQIAKIIRVTCIFYDIVLIGVAIHISNLYQYNYGIIDQIWKKMLIWKDHFSHVGAYKYMQ